MAQYISEKRATVKHRQTLAKPLNESQVELCCSICTLVFEPNQRVVNLACHRLHKLHEECFRDFEQFALSKNQTLVCPICRETIDREAIVKQLLAPVEDADEEALKTDQVNLEFEPQVPEVPKVVAPETINEQE